MSTTIGGEANIGGLGLLQKLGYRVRIPLKRQIFFSDLYPRQGHGTLGSRIAGHGYPQFLPMGWNLHMMLQLRGEACFEEFRDEYKPGLGSKTADQKMLL